MGFLPKGFKPEKIQDSSLGSEFKPLKGKYVCEIEKVTVKEGEWASGDKYKKLALTLRVKETIDGDKGNNRIFFDETSLIDTTYKDNLTKAEAHAAKLNIKLYTAGYDMGLTEDSTESDFIKAAEGAVGTRCNISAWVQDGKQRIKFVEEFVGVKGSSSDDGLPF